MNVCTGYVKNLLMTKIHEAITIIVFAIFATFCEINFQKFVKVYSTMEILARDKF